MKAPPETRAWYRELGRHAAEVRWAKYRKRMSAPEPDPDTLLSLRRRALRNAGINPTTMIFEGARTASDRDTGDRDT